MLDTRTEIQALLGRMEFRSGRALVKLLACLLLALVMAFLPEHAGLSDAGRWTLFILLFAAGLWITEAIAAFAVALLVIAMQIAILGRPGGVFATAPNDWEIFVRPWASPVIWLFFGGFVLAEAATKTGLDRWLARRVLGRFGTRPDRVLLGVMAVTFFFSMFVSNTATTAMMVAVMAPLVGSLAPGDPYARALLLGVPFAANLGGMGTIIGSPPNAIAAGVLGPAHAVDFLTWMLAGVPPALVLLLVAWLYLRWRYPGTAPVSLQALDRAPEVAHGRAPLERWKRWWVVLVFVVTVGLWLTGAWHGVPSPVVSFVPIVAFAVVGVLDADDIRRLHWDVLLMLAGGLSLGVGVAETGLAQWLVGVLPVQGLGVVALAMALAYLTALVSNFMSNTAAANILVPIGLALAAGSEAQVVVPMALGASAAMCLPISTPPNAIAFASRKLAAGDFLRGGLVIGVLAPAVAVAWCWLVFR
jgi:solute carrier family 13 (sodium-dependent dicarboxylate transporter), member 2/3/5